MFDHSKTNKIRNKRKIAQYKTPSHNHPNGHVTDIIWRMKRKPLATSFYEKGYVKMPMSIMASFTLNAQIHPRA